MPSLSVRPFLDAAERQRMLEQLLQLAPAAPISAEQQLLHELLSQLPPAAARPAVRPVRLKPVNRRWQQASLAVLLGGALALGPLSQLAPAHAQTQEPTPGQPYVVRSGDTLSAIARRAYGPGGTWQPIFQANRDQLANPNRILPGQRLNIPQARSIGAPAPAPAGQPQPGSTYTVQRGDTLSSIAQRAYGDPNLWPAIAEANRGSVSNPRMIFSGQQLVIPARPQAAPAPTPPARTHTVQRGDTLSSIAQRAYRDPNRWRDIYRANQQTIGADPARIFPGQRLVLP